MILDKIYNRITNYKFYLTTEIILGIITIEKIIETVDNIKYTINIKTSFTRLTKITLDIKQQQKIFLCPTP